MSKDISSINKDLSFACGRLEELRNNLDNNRISNAKKESYQSQTQETDESSFLSSSSRQKFSSSNMTTAVNSIVFVLSSSDE